MNHKIFKIGMIGAGAISDIYITNIQTKFKNLELVAISANHLENAEKKAEKYSLTACTTEELLRREDIEIVVVLTPVATHYALIKQALNANKHVYTEKTICETTKQAEELLKLAEEKKLVLGCAPDTFLGSCFQTAKAALEEGKIGTVHSFAISINRNNDILTAMFPFLRQPGAGALRDYMVYYLTALTHLLGPIEKCSAMIQSPYLTRINPVPNTSGYNEEISTPNESIIVSALQLRNGCIGTIHENNETLIIDFAEFTLYGTKGILKLGNPNEFGNPVHLLEVSSKFEITDTVLDTIGEYSENDRGVGLAEMAEAIEEKKKPLASAEMAYHVLEVIEAMERSSISGKAEEICSVF